MLSNLYLAYTSCTDVLRHVEVDSATIIGFEGQLIHECSSHLNGINRNVVIVPRKIVSVDKGMLEQCLASTRSSLTGCAPISISSARGLAKVAKVFSVVLTNRNYRLIDKSQVNFMSQSSTPKYIEVHLHPFISNIVSNNPGVDIEKELYHVGDVLEHAIKKGVGVIPSAASPRFREALVATHIDIVLYAMGFSKRERRLMLEFYPTEFLRNWLKPRP